MIIHERDGSQVRHRNLRAEVIHLLERSGGQLTAKRGDLANQVAKRLKTNPEFIRTVLIRLRTDGIVHLRHAGYHRLRGITLVPLKVQSES